MKVTSSLMIILAMTIGGTHSSFAKDTIDIVAFNAENLFDTIDDIDNPRDDTYLPLSVKAIMQPSHDQKCDQYNGSGSFYAKQCKTLDWSLATYNQKLKRYGDVLKAMPATPDIIVISETENKQVLLDLTQQELSSENYNIVQLDSSDEPDSRGIDVGILSKFPVVGDPVAHTIDFGNDERTCGKTRDIVQASFELPDGEPLHVFGVHFPSGRSPFICRIKAFQNLNEIVKTLPANSLAIAAGDFNINCVEAPSDAFTRLLVRNGWYASPLISSGCRAPGSSKFIERSIDNWNTWSFLDMIIVSSELSPTRPSAKNWFADLGSFSTLVVQSEQIMVDEDDKGYIEPRRFDPVSGRGVSDHFPVGIRLVNRR
ncbi:endonuclease/exonuclease/phosphatase family protein [Pararhizobium sp. IMCC21322]|uniref:endonuclease/exonuclease/phosphatase family protein n=1 Tax=Pararhizobium sp. IMCC21322 TaxID=3067903 RepID=UPI002741E0BC|nr:endonuclease/exonuclease/phosphatase family protein [Pararhizobium sp. IMCC21322]